VDIAVVVNLRARRGSESVAEGCRLELPGARILTSRSLGDAQSFARELRRAPPHLLLSAGGDGTAVALINALRRSEAENDAPSGTSAVPVLGVLPLGTGNGWARVTGAPRWRTAVKTVGRAARRASRLPLRRFDLVEVEGQVAHFAGTGWDAEMIEDFHAQKTGFGVLPPSSRNGLGGYLQGLVTRTIPRHVLGQSGVEVELWNTGEDAIGIDDRGCSIAARRASAPRARRPSGASASGRSRSPGWCRAGSACAPTPRGRSRPRCARAGSGAASTRCRRCTRGC
jgi:hypothetical protein